ncbi:hypothetical protein FRB99_008594 [Tulasnella sp. 403]|nr:hypothetical protein FRB99_008594 [Tulasnella sp. 403]
MTASSQDARPQTTNTLCSKDRADLIKKTRKLEQVLGVAMHVVGPLDDPRPQRALDSGLTSTNKTPSRRRLKSLKRTTRPAAPKAGILISTSTSIFVDPSSSPSSPTSSVSSPAISSPSSQESHQQLLTTVAPDTTPHRVLPKKSLVFAPSLSNDAPVLQLVPLSPLSISPVEGSLVVPTSCRSRADSVASIATTDSIESTLTLLSKPDDLHPKQILASNSTQPRRTPDKYPDGSSESFLRQRKLNMAHKLQRHLGEPIPPQLVTGLQRRPSAAHSGAPESSKGQRVTHKRSLSLWVMKPKKASREAQRPATSSSLEVRPVSLEQKPSHRRVASDDASTSQLRVEDPSGSLRSKPSRKTEWTSTLTTLPPNWMLDEAGNASDSSAKPFREALDKPLPDTPLPDMRMSAKEKSLNVRRAVKMTQKFGEAPPHALFQITNTAPKAIVSANNATKASDALSPPASARYLAPPRSPGSNNAYRHSFASSTWSFHGSENSLSVGRRRGASVSSIDSRFTTQCRRISLNSLNGSASIKSAACSSLPASDIKVPSLESDIVMADASDASADDSTSDRQAPAPIVVPLPTNTGPIPSAATSSSPTRHDGVTAQPIAKLTSIFEPPPVAPVETVRPKSRLSRSMSQSFNFRRRQATKLTRLLGVEYPDLYQAMVIERDAAGKAKAKVPIRSPLASGATARSPSIDEQSQLSTFSLVKDLAARRASLGPTISSSTPPPSSDYRIGSAEDSCRWSQKAPSEVKMVLETLRELKV